MTDDEKTKISKEIAKDLLNFVTNKYNYVDATLLTDTFIRITSSFIVSVSQKDKEFENYFIAESTLKRYFNHDMETIKNDII
jgi:hypothetical protein